ncbi:hypothetical protein LXA43DRAFT_545501 [Ganoderma leucocontextum]|nr:hypothetical protein LXA43DRAFT_545501 [Ganoderma leucocontextum]
MPKLNPKQSIRWDTTRYFSSQSLSEPTFKIRLHDLIELPSQPWLRSIGFTSISNAALWWYVIRIRAIYMHGSLLAAQRPRLFEGPDLRHVRLCPDLKIWLLPLEGHHARGLYTALLKTNSKPPVRRHALCCVLHRQVGKEYFLPSCFCEQRACRLEDPSPVFLVSMLTLKLRVLPIQRPRGGSKGDIGSGPVLHLPTSPFPLSSVFTHSCVSLLQPCPSLAPSTRTTT